MKRAKMFAMATGLSFAIQGKAQASIYNDATDDLMKILVKVIVSSLLVLIFAANLWAGMGGGHRTEPDKIAMIFTIILMAFILFGLPLLWAW